MGNGISVPRYVQEKKSLFTYEIGSTKVELDSEFEAQFETLVQRQIYEAAASGDLDQLRFNFSRTFHDDAFEDSYISPLEQLRDHLRRDLPCSPHRSIGTLEMAAKGGHDACLEFLLQLTVVSIVVVILTFM